MDVLVQVWSLGIVWNSGIVWSLEREGEGKIR